MVALFERKAPDLTALEAATAEAKMEGSIGVPYEVIRTVELSDKGFRDFARDLLSDQPWIEADDGGYNREHEIRCIRVLNRETGETVLVNPEGYHYPRYTALEGEDE